MSFPADYADYLLRVNGMDCDWTVERLFEFYPINKLAVEMGSELMDKGKASRFILFADYFVSSRVFFLGFNGSEFCGIYDAYRMVFDSFADFIKDMLDRK